MNLKSWPSKELFLFKDFVIENKNCRQITPRHNIDWNSENIIFRSSVWDIDSKKLLVAGFKKFWNLEENNSIDSLDLNNHIEFIHKMDGSCLQVAKINGELIIKTRGTVDAKNSLENGLELEELKKYELLLNNELINSENYTILLEWYSPNHVIVERESDKTNFWLIGIVNHTNYSYLSQKDLDSYGNKWNIDRPKRYLYQNLQKALQDVKEWEKGEGVIAYSKDGQKLKKIKSPRYLFLHRMVDSLGTYKRVVDFWLLKNKWSKEEFLAYVEENTSWEAKRTVISYINKLYEEIDYINFRFKVMEDIVEPWRGLPRGGAARLIAEMPKEKRQDAFFVLDKKIPDDKLWKKLLTE